MTSAFSVYVFYLEPADLRGKTHTVTVQGATVAEVFNPRVKHNEPRIVLSFVGKQKVMALNKTQAEAMIEIAGTDTIEKWSEKAVTLTPSRTPKGQDTITISAQGKSENDDAYAKSIGAALFGEEQA